MITKEKAISIAKSKRKNFRILKIIVKNKYYLFDMVPKDYNESDGPVMDGALAIDKQTGEVHVYNPVFDN